MRIGLKKEFENRLSFIATFVREGSKKNYHGYPEPTILLKDVINLATNEIVTDHIWFTKTKSWSSIQMNEGDKISFDARVKKYTKGYINNREYINEQTIDYKLSHPSKIKKYK